MTPEQRERLAFDLGNANAKREHERERAAAEAAAESLTYLLEQQRSKTAEACRALTAAAQQVRALTAERDALRGIEPEFPPRPPTGEGTPRYGIRWNGPEAPLAVPMPDGYWTPAHLAEARAEAAEQQVQILTARCRLLATRTAEAEQQARALTAELASTEQAVADLMTQVETLEAVLREAKRLMDDEEDAMAAYVVIDAALAPPAEKPAGTSALPPAE